MKTVPLRYLAEINPQTPQFDAVPDDALVTFLPLETVWSDGRADQTRTAAKSAVASGYTRFQPGDVVCPKVTPTFQAGRSMIAKATGAGTTELHILRPRQDVDPRWVCYAVRSKHFLDEGVTAFQGVAGLQRVPPEFVASFRVADVGPDQQRRIADFLDDRIARIDQIITARRQQVASTEALRSSRLVEAVFGAADQLVPCRAFCEVRLGRQRSPAQESGEHMRPYLRSANVIDGRLLLEDVKEMNFEPAEQAVFALRPGDVLVTEGSASPEAIGASAVWRGDLPGVVCFQNTLLRLRARSDCDPGFLGVWARASHAAGAARVFAGGASILHLGAEGMARLPFPRIPLVEQRRRAHKAKSLLSSSATLKTAELRSIGLLTEYKQSLITAAVSGELDVSTVGSGIPG